MCKYTCHIIKLLNIWYPMHALWIKEDLTPKFVSDRNAVTGHGSRCGQCCGVMRCFFLRIVERLVGWAAVFFGHIEKFNQHVCGCAHMHECKIHNYKNELCCPWFELFRFHYECILLFFCSSQHLVSRSHLCPLSRALWK